MVGLTVLVTAGPTREPLDPVRYLPNRSSGKMGYALARTAALRGARVVLVSGPTHLEPPTPVETIQVETAAEMHDAVIRYAHSADLIIKAAAVSDYRPESISTQKKKKQAENLVIPVTKS